ncbi:DNA alkylation repair protein [Terriglobus saanensis]|uniref:DNA alkylation repair enzyme n=1 Tax=Terriglobus saanensis (strain ATCC BAA-1853 / DSM 23119 / SP1PR4) TaxID=401053 RepID=E8V645_TERSS|nr:DNA alkylation repair protein [Terriglobus saanensis]ADV84936.1 DNA alkylation repair enzyme [Terriglobus saanensis SP1PR4]
MAQGNKLNAAAVRREVHALRDPERAVFLQRFFRTGPGEYAEGDRMLGLTVPAQRVVARAFRALPLEEIAKLLASPFHEHRLIALLILVDRHTRGDEVEQLLLHRFYLTHLDAVNNWDLVDTSAAALVGEHVSEKLLQKLLASPNLWHRRVAIVCTFAELRAGRVETTFRVAERLLGDKHDLIHKAVGWLLREAGKRSPEALLSFLRTHYDRVPRTTLRYAIERLDVVDRKLWLGGPQ